MNAHIEKNQCRYCQIDLVNIQLSKVPTTQYSSVENKQPPSSVMKCPVCGYSELAELALAENHAGYTEVSIIGHQVSAT